MDMKDGACKRCRAWDKNIHPGEPFFFSHGNHLDVGVVPRQLPSLTQVEEMVIARVHVFVNVMQIRGQQYLYRGHVVHFLRDVGKIYDQLPLLPAELDIVLLKPKNTDDSDRLRQQFRRLFRVRRSCVKQWLDWPKAQYPCYRDIVVSQERLIGLLEDGNALQDIPVQEVDAVQLGDKDINSVADHFDDPEQGTVPNLLFNNSEAAALEAQLHGLPSESTPVATEGGLGGPSPPILVNSSCPWGAWGARPPNVQSFHTLIITTCYYLSRHVINKSLSFLASRKTQMQLCCRCHGLFYI